MPFWTASLSMALLRLTPHRTAVQLGILKGGNPVTHWVPVAVQMLRASMAPEPGTPCGTHAPARQAITPGRRDVVTLKLGATLEEEDPESMTSASNTPPQHAQRGQTLLIGCWERAPKP